MPGLTQYHHHMRLFYDADLQHSRISQALQPARTALGSSSLGLALGKPDRSSSASLPLPAQIPYHTLPRAHLDAGAGAGGSAKTSTRYLRFSSNTDFPPVDLESGKCNVGGGLVQNFIAAGSKAHQGLWNAIGGVGGSHRSEQQFYRGQCLKGTREMVLGAIHDWRTSATHSPPICWLSGAAGVGKSAIAMTVAKSCEDDGLAASFFFFRSDPKRNNPSALMLTITHGLITNMPFARTFINRRISDDPTILEATLEEQFQDLVLKPSLRWKWLKRLLANLSLTSKESRLVIIDGLDECADDETQLRILSIILSSYEQSPRSPLQFLICSRPESWIRKAFEARSLHQITKPIVLDDKNSLASRDIKRYYLHQFEQIRRDPKYARVRFPKPWPSVENLVRLVRKASGQFVYAATVIKFILLAYHNPITQLRIILDYTPQNHSSNSSFSELDRLYHIVFSINPNHEKLLSILAAIIFVDPYVSPTPMFVEFLLNLPSGDVDLTLRAMHSVLDVRGGRDAIRVFHISFRDYILDETRSGPFCIDRAAQRDLITQKWLQALSVDKVKKYK
ncbi:hypothetical protein PM082_002106 [Marasmius tenuissimus]|nr:hypothetical protein PM082_002106 [Marasmius tenuissimus]